MEKFIERKIFEKKLNKRIESKRTGWLSNEFTEAFEAEFFIDYSSQNESLNIINRFLEDNKIKDLIFFPDANTKENLVGGWQTYSRERRISSVTFDSVKETMEFLKDNVFWVLKIITLQINK